MPKITQLAQNIRHGCFIICCGHIFTCFLNKKKRTQKPRLILFRKQLHHEPAERLLSTIYYLLTTKDFISIPVLKISFTKGSLSGEKSLVL